MDEINLKRLRVEKPDSEGEFQFEIDDKFPDQAFTWLTIGEVKDLIAFLQSHLKVEAVSDGFFERMEIMYPETKDYENFGKKEIKTEK